MNIDPNTLLQGESVDVGNQLPDINSMITEMLGPFIWASVALTVLMIFLYVYSMTRRRKVERAILDMQKAISEMNERDKARSQSNMSNPPRMDDRIIAQVAPEPAPSAENQN